MGVYMKKNIYTYTVSGKETYIQSVTLKKIATLKPVGVKRVAPS